MTTAQILAKPKRVGTKWQAAIDAAKGGVSEGQETKLLLKDKVLSGEGRSSFPKGYLQAEGSKNHLKKEMFERGVTSMLISMVS